MSEIAKKAPVAGLILLALAIWDLNDATAPYSVPDATLFLGIVAAILAFAFVSRKQWGAPVPAGLFWMVVACLFVGALMTPLRLDFYAQYVLADAGTMVLFGVSLVVCAKYQDKLFTERTVVWFTAIYCVIAVVAYLSAAFNIRPEYRWHGRWDPPYFMLFAALALLVRFDRKSLFRFGLYAALLVASAGLALYSGNRTQFALGALFVALAWFSDPRAAAMMFMAVVVFFLFQQLGLIDFDPFAELFADTRFSLLEGGVDESLRGRFREVNDVWYHVANLNSPLQKLFGRGFGATWQQITSFARENVIDGSNTVHYIHIGFVNLGYRYGIFGLALFAYWVWIVASNVGVILSKRASIAERFWYLGAVGFVLNFFVQNSLYDPPAVIAMAAFAVWANQRAAERHRRSAPIQDNPVPA